MGRYPTQQMRTAYNKVKVIPLNDDHARESFGKYKEHELVHLYDKNDGTDYFQYYHYSTLCCTIARNNGQVKLIIGAGSYSVTDRDNINGLIYLLKIPRLRAFKKRDSIYIMLDLKKTSFDEYTIDLNQWYREQECFECEFNEVCTRHNIYKHDGCGCIRHPTRD